MRLYKVTIREKDSKFHTPITEYNLLGKDFKTQQPLSDEEIDAFMENLLKAQIELNQIGFDTQLGTDEDGKTGMIELRIRKRQARPIDLKVLTFVGKLLGAIPR